jgi:hypothetical protein
MDLNVVFGFANGRGKMEIKSEKEGESSISKEKTVQCRLSLCK